MARSVAKLGKLKTKTISNRQGAISCRRGHGGRSAGKTGKSPEMDSK